MQDHQIAALADPCSRQRAVAGAELLKLHLETPSSSKLAALFAAHVCK
jgi:hypothetical protein